MVKHYDERGITEWKRVSLEQWFPDSRQDESYAVFGGDIFQRDVAVEQGIARCFGHRAILVIHNNFSLETELKNTDHKLVLRMSKKKNQDSLGTECQIRNFVVNQ